MKKTSISIFIILICYLGYGQTYPVTQNLGNTATTKVKTNALEGKLIITAFTDTTAANTEGYLKNYDGSLIKTTSPINALWYRVLDSAKWVQILPTGGGSGGTRAWLDGGNYNVFGDGNGNAVFGTLNLNGVKLTTNATTRLILNKTGIQAETANTVPLGVDTVTKDITYSTGGGGSSSWLLAGNTGTNPLNDFIGTTDAQDLVFKTNGNEVVRFLSDGGWLLPTTNINGGTNGITWSNIDTWVQQTTGGSSIVNTSGGIDYTMENGTLELLLRAAYTGSSQGSEITLTQPSITLRPNAGVLIIDTLNYQNNSNDSMMVWRPTTGYVGMRAIPTSSSGTVTNASTLTNNSLVIGQGGNAVATVTTGTGVLTALGVNTGSAGAFVVNGGALGTPSSGTVTNLTGTASININGTVGATTPTTGVFTTVGIGTASPTYKLHVNGNSVMAQAASSAGVGDGYIWDETGSNYFEFLKRGSAAIGNMSLPVGSVELINYTNGSMGLINYGSGYIAFGTNGANERMRIDNSGNVGIDNTSPTSKLHTTSFSTAYVAKTANYTATISDHTIHFTANTSTFTFPTAVGVTGRIYVVRNDSGNTLSLATTSSQTINGAAPGTQATGTVLQYQSTGANWITISQ